ncbi:MAG: hypothetical protein P8Y71_22890, partial [Pseudolabrys sp.]
PLDLDPGQVVRWLKAECEAAPESLRVTARRSREVREIPLRQEAHLGDEERQDLTEIDTIATLEIAPPHVGEGWRLNVVVEDEAGPRMAKGDDSGATEQAIDLGAFDNEFIRPGRGIANVFAEVENEMAKGHVARLVHAIETNRHAEQGRPERHSGGR